MGKIKTKLVKKSAEELLKKDFDFSEDFEKNKKILTEVTTSKKIRNQIAGYIVRLKKKQLKENLKMKNID